MKELADDGVIVRVGCGVYARVIKSPFYGRPIPKEVSVSIGLESISKKWTMPIQNWKAALNRFTIMFDERMPQH